MEKRKKMTCSQIRMVSHGVMTAGFFLLVAAVGLWAGEPAEGMKGAWCSVWTGTAGAALFVCGFFIKLAGWRCPCCRACLMLCMRGRGDVCPCCGCILDQEPPKE